MVVPEPSDFASDPHAKFNIYSTEELHQIAKTLGVPVLSDSDQEALQDAAWNYTWASMEEECECEEKDTDFKKDPAHDRERARQLMQKFWALKEENGNRAKKDVKRKKKSPHLPEDQRQILKRIEQEAPLLEGLLMQLNNRILRGLGAGDLVQRIRRLEASAHSARQNLPKRGSLPRKARHEFVDALADIYERVKPAKKAGLSKHDQPTGPFYRFANTALGLIDKRATTGLPHVISEVVKVRKRRD